MTAAGAAVVLVALTLVVVTAVFTGRADTALTGCDNPVEVRVAANPDIADAVRAAAQPVAGQRVGGRCVHLRVDAMTPVRVLDLLASGQADRPSVWVPDTSLWQGQARGVPLETAGSMASSPVVLATSPAVATARSWQEGVSFNALTNGGPGVVLPDPTSSGVGLLGLVATAAAFGPAPKPDQLASAFNTAAKVEAPTLDAAFAMIRTAGAKAPTTVSSEQAVWAANGSGTDVQAVYPKGATFELDYPVLRVPPTAAAPAGQEEAVALVTAALRSSDGHKAVMAAGFRTPEGRAPDTFTAKRGVQAQAPPTLPLPEQAQALSLVRLWSAVTTRSRLLAVIDLSLSMQSQAGPSSRIQLASAAATRALQLYPDNAKIGLWGFATNVSQGHDWLPLQAIRPLSARVGGTSQRAALLSSLMALPGELKPGGTGLYETALAAFRTVRAGYDPNAVNAVVLMTDGRNDDPTGISLDTLIKTLQAENDPAAPVVIIGIGIGPDADQAALQQISRATGGSAYVAKNPADLQTVVADALTKRQCRPNC